MSSLLQQVSKFAIITEWVSECKPWGMLLLKLTNSPIFASYLLYRYLRLGVPNVGGYLRRVSSPVEVSGRKKRECAGLAKIWLRL